MQNFVEVIVCRLQIKAELSGLSIVQVVAGLHPTQHLQPMRYLGLAAPAWNINQSEHSMVNINQSEHSMKNINQSEYIIIILNEKSLLWPIGSQYLLINQK